MEMAFVTQEDIMGLTEGLVAHMFADALPCRPQPQVPFPRMTHAKAMEMVSLKNSTPMRGVMQC